MYITVTPLWPRWPHYLLRIAGWGRREEKEFVWCDDLVYVNSCKDQREGE